MSLFPHRYDYIWADHSSPGSPVEWKTESRHPLGDRLIQQGAFLYGVRFGSETQYCLLDIDRHSPYHPSRDPQAIARILGALEFMGLVSYVACTSSYSGGIHLYFPFDQPQKTWQVAIALQTVLENAGFAIALGKLELFPNAKPFVTAGHPSLYAAHRLPLQAGSYLLNGDWDIIHTAAAQFVDRWRFAQSRNVIDSCTLRQLLKAARRQQYGLSGKADKFLNDLNAEIEVGWTGFGQTNVILGRIALRSYVFGHVLYATHPLEGQALVDDIVRVAKSLPGYHQWCRHQHEIEKRAEEWARSVEASHYFHFQRGQKGRSRTMVDPAIPDPSAVPPSWNQRQQQEARDRIQRAIADLLNQGILPATATARFQALTHYGIGGGSLYRHRDLWHPAHLLQPVENPPDPPSPLEVGEWESQNDSHSPATPSLLGPAGGNGLVEAGLEPIAISSQKASGRNPPPGVDDSRGASDQKAMNDRPQHSCHWIQTVLMNLDHRQKMPQVMPQITPQVMPQITLKVAALDGQHQTPGDRLGMHQRAYLERMRTYLQSGDPILMAEARRVLGDADLDSALP